MAYFNSLCQITIGETVNLKDSKKTIDAGLNAGKLIVVIGSCSVKYEGRAASKLSEGDRMLIIKKDGTFLVHQSKGMAAINYQGPGSAILTALSEDGNSLMLSAVRKTKNSLPGNVREQIVVNFKNVQFVEAFELQDDKKLKVFGTEGELSSLLMQDLNLIEPGLLPVQQESPLPKGHIDILARDKDNNLVIIEVKRRQAELAAVSQLKRYVDEVSKRKNVVVRGIICAPSMSENSKKMLDEYGFEFYKLNYEIGNPSAKIIGLEKKQKILGEY